jgi:hypothetical protein
MTRLENSDRPSLYLNTGSWTRATTDDWSTHT